jgi:hypothetical protein
VRKILYVIHFKDDRSKSRHIIRRSQFRKKGGGDAVILYPIDVRDRFRRRLSRSIWRRPNVPPAFRTRNISPARFLIAL